MSERLKFVLFIVFSLIVFWFTIILLCLPQSEPWPPSSPQNHDAHRHDGLPIKTRRKEPKVQSQVPKTPADIMQPFQAKPLSLLDTLFYQFDSFKDVTNITNDHLVVSEKEHKDTTLRLSSITGPTEHYVKSRGDRLFAFNLLASNRVGLLRPLPDTRQAKCPRTVKVSAPTYTSSIVICYYNEAPSALVRTIHSILSRTEHRLLKEIIVVDDFSDPGYDVDHIQPRLGKFDRNSQGLIKFVRTPKREGLIRARLFGAAMAQGHLLVFLDSHVEPNTGWLEPLVMQIQQNQTTVACPMIDLINAETMLYTASPMVKGGLTWALHFKWNSVPASTLKTYDDFVKPIKSPSMAGGLYAIHRDFFYRLGAYDPGMNLWGGENVELSLKAWMCGGQILILPCSRVGHIFRKTRPYGPAPNEPDSLTYNSHRVARVWLDEYLDKYYELVPQARDLDSGDVGERIDLRDGLKCRNFTWYLDNVYPQMRDQSPEGGKDALEGSRDHKEGLDVKKPGNLFGSKRVNRSARQRARQARPDMEPPAAANLRFQRDNDEFSSLSTSSEFRVSNGFGRRGKIDARFQIQLKDSNLCLEPKVSLVARLKFSRLVLDNCVEVPANASSLFGTNQVWTKTDSHEIRLADNYCLDIMKNLPLLRKCHSLGSYQAWSYTNETSGSHIMSYYSNGNLCLAVERVQRGEPVIVTICDTNPHESSKPPLPAEEAGLHGQRAQQGRRRRRHHRNLREISVHNRNAEATWFTGPIPFSHPANRRGKFAEARAQLLVHQRWTLVDVPASTR